MGIEIEVNSLDEMCDLMCYNKIPKRRKQMNPKDEIKDAFITVGIELRAKMEELSNARQIKEAKEIEKAYEIINKYFDDALMWPWPEPNKDLTCDKCVHSKDDGYNFHVCCGIMEGDGYETCINYYRENKKRHWNCPLFK